MPKVSRESASKISDTPPAEDRSEELGDYTVNFVKIKQDADLAPMLADLPDGRCQCPHWGYVFAGRLTFTYGDREEVYEPGDAFYVPAGHTPRAEQGTEFVQFSPTHEFAELTAALTAKMQAMQAG